MSTFLFFLSILITAAVTVLVNKNIHAEKLSGIRRILPLILSCVLIAVSMLGYTGVINAGPYQDVWTFTSLISSVLCFISYIEPGRFRKEYHFLIKIITVAAVLELTVFSLPSYRTWTGNYPVKEISFSDVKTECDAETTDSGIVLNTEDEFEGVVSGINIPVSTVEFCVRYTDPRIQNMKVQMDIKDETQAKEYRENITESKIITYRPDSNFVQCDFSGNVSDMRFRMKLAVGEDVVLEKLVLNSPVPFDVQYVRFLLIVIVSLFIYSTACDGVLSGCFKDEKMLCRGAAVIITAAAMLAAFKITSYRMTDRSWYDCFHLTEGNQVTEELVEAFKSGHVYLGTEPEEFLFTLDNPYDTNERDMFGEHYSWDHVLYNGHYYSYYGIAPVILLMLPYNLITGYYCADEFAILVFAFAALCGIARMYMVFVRKWFSDISAGVVIACLFILQISCGLWYSVGRADFYEVSLSAGLAFISWAGYFFLRSGVPEKGKISKRYTALSSLFFALAVLSRPTLAVYCICAAAFMLAAVPSTGSGRILSSGKVLPVGRQTLTYLVCAFVPMAALGIVQMIYNYSRFGSVLDFGIQYSLTINDFTKSQFHFKFCALAIYNYLFNPPVIQSEYPFVRTQFQHMYQSGYFYEDILCTLNTSGLFALVPLSWFYLAAKRALRTFGTRRDKIIMLMKIAVPCLLAPFIIIMSVWESGYAVRYMGDFSVEIIMGAYVFMFLVLKTTNNQTIKKLVTYAVCASVVWVICIEGIQIVNQAFRYQENVYNFPEIAYDVERLVSVWK